MFWEINFSTFAETILKEFNLTTCKETEIWSLKPEGRRQTQSRHISNADKCNKAVDYEFYIADGITAELHGRTPKTANIGIAIRQIPYSTISFSVESSIPNSSDYLF